MNRDSVLQEFRDTITKDSLKARNLIRKLNYKDDPYLLQCIAQTYLDESRFNEDGIQREYLDWRKWRMAERYIIKAFELDSNCLIVLYTMGSLRKSSGQADIAIYCFEKIIKLGIKAESLCQNQLTVSLANELVNDSKFELYRLYRYKDPVLSKKYLYSYRRKLKKGVNTIFRPLEDFLLG
ncbi:hypothetical protein [Chitinophaga japonensis]|uniref:Tetratricopeptide repeat protein n=1 Tax=Chitinophaga japonensis TaxID=104662 RepID=A0A562SZQ9_CHIJA|nr:hypothetical protein [Chitinophaga japonensis]TWI86593.1 hypothetical protein LX66_3852 [Chitinophaga japonensis]